MIRDPDTLAALVDSVRRFVRERLVPAEARVAEADAIPEDIVADMKALGLFGGREGQGFKTAMKVLDKGRLHVGAVCVGVARRHQPDPANGDRPQHAARAPELRRTLT